MAYLHCHNCPWSQDDFWDFRIEWKRFFKWTSRPFGYNPFSLILEDIASYWRPRYIGMDSYWMKENGFKGTHIHSWQLMKWEIRRHFRRISTMKWWTYKSFKKAYDQKKAVCPKCGSSEHFDID